ncbi:MAG: hypothetical protein V4683_12850 [Bacteroidota bacterium]
MQLPNEDNFESAFKEAFDKASLAPPDIIWNNIEKSLPQPTAFGSKPDVQNLASSTKLMIGTGIIVVSAIAYFYLNPSSTNSYNTKLKPTRNEKSITKSLEPTIMDSKPEIENLAPSPAFIAKKLVKLPIKVTLEDEPMVDQPEIQPTEIATISSSKIEDRVFEMSPKGLKMPQIIMDTPDLVTNTDSQKIVPYYDPNGIPIPQNNKRRFWENIKVRGGIRVSN